MRALGCASAAQRRRDEVLRWCLIIGTIIASLVAAMLFIGSVIGWRLY
jgi:hypothetical protein